MKKSNYSLLVVLIALLVFLATSCSGSRSSGSSKQKINDALTAYNNAKKEGKPIFVNFYTPT